MIFDNLLWYDFLSSCLSLIGTIYFIRGSSATWSLILSSAVISCLLFWKIELYGQLFLKAVYIVFSIYGFIHWGKNKDQSRRVLVRVGLSLSDCSLGLIAAIFGLCWYELWPVLFRTTLDPRDCFIACLFLYAQWLASRRYLCVWFVWFLGDIVLIPLLYHLGAYCQMLYAIICLPLALIGYRSWRAQYRDQTLCAAS